MFSPRRATPILPIWLLGIAPCLAQDAAAPPGQPAWSTLADASPGIWGAVLIVAVCTLALLAQMFYLLRRGGVAPQALVDALTQSIQAGNYQEAWENCRRWRQTALGRILQPAMERIGQGLAAVESRLAEESRRVAVRTALLLGGLLAGAALVALLCLGGIFAVTGRAAAAAMSPDAPRLATLAAGDAAMLGAVALAVAAVSGIAWTFLRGRARDLLASASEQGRQLLAGLPYEEIEGVRIGKDFHAGTILGDEGLTQTGRLQVSRELTTQCPSCNGPINPSRNSCPHCGQLLSWS